jgi:hypothetical protein
MDVWETLKSTMCKTSEGKSRLDAISVESDDDCGGLNGSVEKCDTETEMAILAAHFTYLII